MEGFILNLTAMLEKSHLLGVIFFINYCLLSNETQIFGSPRIGFIRFFKQFFFPKHSWTNLNRILKNAFLKYSDDNDTRLGHSKTRLCIPAFNASIGNIVVFKTSHHISRRKLCCQDER